MKTKKINRGLALGAAVIIGTSMYIGYDTLSFKSSKSDIEAAVKDYIAATADANVKSGTDNSKWESLINDNWSYNRFYDKSYYYRTADEIKREIRYERETGDIGEILECTPKILSITVKKEGPDLAKAIVKYSFDFKAKGNVYFMPLSYPVDIMQAAIDMNYGDSYNNNALVKDTEYSGTITCDNDMEFILQEDDGEWKIVACGGEEYTNLLLYDKDGEPFDYEKLLGKEDEEGMIGGDENA
ncbi:MAG: hypothetical protein IJ740_00400 [Ruminococcus sp.]|nr:hypothetical protein [Ruminococcus sp.]